ncbi:hypothetical protein Bca52824_021881 [Brassica carinata]|uniref:Zinc knuckle CX2CX4HX4C domain-containing protein n=1 Tax=Brassica carinata TaxID=52824 RepID=A0A8X7VFN1_BRACI|nr:hypothetical protein Bca52824_021881 [Brassica carinata]
MNFKFQGKDTLIDFSYPWLPTKCSTCGKWGHSEKVCLKQKEVEEVRIDADSAPKQSETNHPVVSNSGGSHIEVSEKGQRVEVIEDKSFNNKEQADDREKNWSTPVKVSRTSEKAKERELDQDSILSSSRFAVLSSEEEEGEIPQQEPSTTVEVPPQAPIQKKQEVSVKAASTRPSLPRTSKDNHKIISNSIAPKTNDCGPSLGDKKSTKK